MKSKSVTGQVTGQGKQQMEMGSDRQGIEKVQSAGQSQILGSKQHTGRDRPVDLALSLESGI